MPSLRVAVVQVSVAAAAALACLAAATQWTAAMLGYQPALGPPVVDLLAAVANALDQLRRGGPRWTIEESLANALARARAQGNVS